MDSLSQAALGAAVGIAVMGRRTAPWKAAIAGALFGTLPDLDNFIDQGDPIRNMTLHRANSHALFWLTLASLPLAYATAKAFCEMDRFGRWWFAVWLILITHPLLDWMTVYGTQLARPFSEFPFAVGSIFIIDPLYTLPLLIGTGVALTLRNGNGRRWNLAGLIASTLYLGWGVLAQHHVREIAEESLRADGATVERLLVTPTPLNSVLWRVVAVTPQGYREGFHSLLDGDRRISFDRYPRGETLYATMRGNDNVERIAAFSHGFFKMGERGGNVVITDLRMGQEPYYGFNFVVGQKKGDTIAPVTPTSFREQHDMRNGVNWIWRRALGEKIPPPK